MAMAESKDQHQPQTHESQNTNRTEHRRRTTLPHPEITHLEKDCFIATNQLIGPGNVHFRGQAVRGMLRICAVWRHVCEMAFLKAGHGRTIREARAQRFSILHSLQLAGSWAGQGG